MKPKAAPTRLHVLLSRDGRTAVIIRREPSKVCCIIGWDRVKDEFTIGQWLRGRIYERRCDLSPDGRHLIYFAYKGAPHSTTGGSYTGISLAPWLHAVGLWGNGSAWNGGGLFVSDTESLYAARITRSGLDEPLVLQDFTPMTYRPLRAPYEVPPLPKE